MASLTKQQMADEIVKRLEQEYPKVECGLRFEYPWQLLVAVRLSAQCTDERVNIVAKELFTRFPTLEALAASSVSEIESIVRPCGLGMTKANDIYLAMNMLLNDFGGEIPSTMEQLLEIPGVGRKSANLILGEVFSLPAIIVDTHCIRLSFRLGLSESNNPTVIEKELKQLIPQEKGTNFCHRLITFGRTVCTARSFNCEQCFMNDICKTAKKK